MATAVELVDRNYTIGQLPFDVERNASATIHRGVSVSVEQLLGAFLLVIALPFTLFLICLVRLTSKGPGLYRQIRVGRHGRLFTLLKIRTMVVDAELPNQPQWTYANDPRITPLGRILRKTHWDELPQLWNVARGEMSLIGPRPERPELVHLIASRIPGYLSRLSILPGITGLAQINLPPDSDLEDVRRKLVLDLEYMRTAHLGLNARIFVWSVLRFLGCPATRATHLMGLRRSLPSRKRIATQTPITLDTILSSDVVRRKQAS